MRPLLFFHSLPSHFFFSYCDEHSTRSVWEREAWAWPKTIRDRLKKRETFIVLCGKLNLPILKSLIDSCLARNWLFDRVCITHAIIHFDLIDSLLCFFFCFLLAVFITCEERICVAWNVILNSDQSGYLLFPLFARSVLRLIDILLLFAHQPLDSYNGFKLSSM